VKVKAVRQHKFLTSALGAALVILCGLVLWKTPPGEPWVNASYDYLFRFGAHAITNKVTLILMDNAAFDQFHQQRGQPWDRELHAKLLNKLADDGAELVVFDSFFRATNNPAKDDALASAMRRTRHVVLMAEQSQVTHPGLAGAQPTLPAELFLSAAKTNWGVAYLDPDSANDSVVRRHWPFPSPGPYPSFPETIARVAGAKLDDVPQEKWLRYYGQNGAWTKLSYQFALQQPANYFRNQIVFIGTQPHTSLPGDGELDKFRTPYTSRTAEASGGVEIMVTSFLNLVNGDWLRRPAWWTELLALVISGTLLGGGLCRMQLRTAFVSAGVVAVIIALAAISWSYFTNYWSPWLVVVGGQMPCALIWMLAMRIRRTNTHAAAMAEPMPETPGYELVHPPFAEGAYGKVWLARNPAGQWVALKVIYLAKFDGNPAPYEREFNGVQKYKPVSDQHPGLLRVDFVSEKGADYFYYVMELGDSLQPGWHDEPALYQPRDLVSDRAKLRGRRLPVKECVHIGITLCEALEFLHQQGMTHRDIKPQNIIFVNGQPKLADLGLITDIRPPDQERTLVGTPGYMPPSPERPGTVAADIYALGMVLYVLCTGRAPTFFPEVATTLVRAEEPPEFLPLNTVILNACQPFPADRYGSAAHMNSALKEAQTAIEKFSR